MPCRQAPPLDGRLAAAAALVAPGSRVADVGCDHGKLAVWLAATGRAARVIAIDRRAQPLARAQLLVQQTGCGPLVECRLADGLLRVDAQEVDTVVLAGLSGVTICEILAAAPWTASPAKRIVAVPANKPEVLRGWLARQGFAILRETAALAAGRAYAAMLAEWDGAPRALTPLACWLGALADDPAPAARALRAQTLRRLRRLLAGRGGAAQGRYDEAALAALREVEKEMEQRCR